MSETRLAQTLALFHTFLLGQIGTLVEDDRTSCPFLVEGPNGCSHWYNDGALVVHRSYVFHVRLSEVVNKEDKALLTPLGDMCLI